MRIAFVGKGGSGKTALSSLFAWHILAAQKTLLLIDADINQHIAQSMQWPNHNRKDLGNHLPELKAILRHKNTLIPSAQKMVKTTLPGPGSHMITLRKSDPVLQEFASQHDSGFLLSVGGFTEEDLGQRCYHAKTGGVELVLNHLADTQEDTVIVDMTAGADAFASGLFTRFDLTIVVVEPTLKSISVYEQYKKYAQEFRINIKVIGNKVSNDEDKAFIKQHCGADILGFVSNSSWLKQAEQGKIQPIANLEPGNIMLLDKLDNERFTIPRNWSKYWEQGVHFHKLNAKGWANEDMGCDVTQYIDETYLQTFTPN